jgi:hypothetical protein
MTPTWQGRNELPLRRGRRQTHRGQLHVEVHAVCPGRDATPWSWRPPRFPMENRWVFYGKPVISRKESWTMILCAVQLSLFDCQAVGSAMRHVVSPSRNLL